MLAVISGFGTLSCKRRALLAVSGSYEWNELLPVVGGISVEYLWKEKKACTIRENKLHKSYETLKKNVCFVLRYGLKNHCISQVSHTWNFSWAFQGHSYLIFSHAVELSCGEKWIYHQISYCGCYTVDNIITSPSPIVSGSQKKCHYVRPSFLVTKLVKFSAEFCSIVFEMHAFDFCILFLEEPINRVDLNKVCLGKYLWLSLLLRCSNLDDFISVPL